MICGRQARRRGCDDAGGRPGSRGQRGRGGACPAGRPGACPARGDPGAGPAPGRAGGAGSRRPACCHAVGRLLRARLAVRCQRRSAGRGSGWPPPPRGARRAAPGAERLRTRGPEQHPEPPQCPIAPGLAGARVHSPHRARLLPGRSAAPGGRVLGVLEVMREPGYRFSPGDEDLLRGLAGAVAVAVSNARLLRQAQEEVAERRRAEAALRESEARLAEAQRIAHLGSWEWDVLQDRITWSDELYRIYGLAPQQFQATFAAFLECIHPDDRERVQQHVEQAARSGAPFEFQHRIIRPDGTIRVLHARGEVFVDASGQPVRMAGTGQDVTEQQETELRAQQLRVEQAARAEAEAAERRLQAILDGSPAVISVKDTEGRYLTINRRYETLLGVSRAQVRGLTDYDLFPPEVADTLRENDQRALRTRAPVETEEVIRLPDGPHTYLEIG